MLAPVKLSSLARLIFALPLILVVPANATAQADEVRVTLFHDTHLHGQLEGPDRQSIADYVGLINAQRAKLPPGTVSFFVGNGDDVASSLMSALFRGQHVVDSFNAAGAGRRHDGQPRLRHGP